MCVYERLTTVHVRDENANFFEPRQYSCNTEKRRMQHDQPHQCHMQHREVSSNESKKKIVGWHSRRSKGIPGMGLNVTSLNPVETTSSCSRIFQSCDTFSAFISYRKPKFPEIGCFAIRYLPAWSSPIQSRNSQTRYACIRSRTNSSPIWKVLTLDGNST